LNYTSFSLSVVIPNYNSGDYLREAVRSVLADKYVTQVIVVDNGSTDDSVRGIESLSERVNVHRIQNQGLIGLSRNYGVSKSNCTWIGFLDSDDLWEPFKTQKLLPYLHYNDFLFHEMRFIINGDLTRIPYAKSAVWQYNPIDPIMWMLKYGNPIITSSVLVRRELFLENSGFSTARELVGIEDFELWIRLFSTNLRHEFVQDILGSYRIHDKSHNYQNQDYKRCWALMNFVSLTGSERKALCEYCTYLFFRNFISNVSGMSLANKVKMLTKNFRIGLIPYIIGRLFQRMKG